jgi:hypothetical protein
MTIIILGGADDEHAAHMLQYLHAGGRDAELLDSRDFPERMQLSFDPKRESGSIRLFGGRTLDIAQIRSIYWRCYHGIPKSPLRDPEQAYIAANDARGLLESLLIRLPARWVNSWAAFQLHQTKPVQLAIVASLGVPVPETLLANDPESVLAFSRRHPRCIFKPVQGGAHARTLTASHLDERNLANLAFAPVTLQEEIPGTNIRVFVAGTRVLSCEIRTAELDFRDDPSPRILPHSLPAEVEAMCLRIAPALDLLWTGIDLRLTPEGSYVFLEANPSPMFLGFERQTGLPLTESLAALLVQPA